MGPDIRRKTIIPSSAIGDSIDISSIPSTYSGLLDDVFLRYSDDLKSEDFFRKMIAKNVLFGGGVFINDGYLVNHPIARRYLTSDGNILRVMVNQGFVRVLTRAENGEALADMPLTMAERGIRSYQEFTQTSEWSAFRKTFRNVALNVFRTGNARRWPKMNMSYGYAKLMGLALNKTPQELGLTHVSHDELKYIRDRFVDSRPEEGNPRDKFERVASEVLKEHDHGKDWTAAMREIMDIANQCYHYNFGLAMMGDFKESDEQHAGMAVDTTCGAAFSEFLEARCITHHQLDTVPLLRVPPDFPFEDGYIFEGFLDPASRIGQAKLRYLHELNRVLSSAMGDAADAQVKAARDDLVEATDAYARRISEHVANWHYRIVREGMVESPLSVGLGRVQDPAKGLVASNKVLAIKLVEAAKDYSCDFLFKRFRMRGALKEDEIEPEAKILVKDIRPQIASLAFDPLKANSFLSDIPTIE